MASVQLKPEAKIDADALLEFVRERTPERAAVPEQLFFVDPMLLIAVGKVFKPALRWEASARVVCGLRAGLPPAGTAIDVSVGAHESHGS